MSANYPESCLYHRDALWLRLADNGEAVVGVTHFAQGQLGPVMFVDLPRAGATVKAGAPMGTIESRKAVSDLIAPASGKVLEINTTLRRQPDLVNKSCYADGWLLRIALSAAAEEIPRLYDAAGYTALLGPKA